MKNKKTILSILLCLCLLTGLLPLGSSTMQVYAAGNNKAIQTGAEVLAENANSATAATVYFGTYSIAPIPWRVIGYTGTGAATAAGALTLLLKSNLETSQFYGSSNHYSGSVLKTAVEDIVNGFQPVEQSVLLLRTLDGIAGTAVTDAKLWPLSTAEANDVNQDLRRVSSYWWLRSPGFNVRLEAFVDADGNVNGTGHLVNFYHYGIRPALHVNLSSVLFTSAAEDGKISGASGAAGLTQVPDYTGSEWKLTLKDSSRSGFSASLNAGSSATLFAGESIQIDYSGAKTGTNEYVSAIITNADNHVLYYGNIANNSASGTQEVNIPAALPAGNYSLKVFSEQCNGDKKTDYASDFKEISLTIKAKNYTISVNPTALNFGSTDMGYGTINPRTVTVQNTGNQSVTLTQPTAMNYDVGSLSKETLAVGDSATFTVAPKTGLREGSYNETLTVSNTNGTGASVSLRFSVDYPAPPPTEAQINRAQETLSAMPQNISEIYEPQSAEMLTQAIKQLQWALKYQKDSKNALQRAHRHLMNVLIKAKILQSHMPRYYTYDLGNGILIPIEVEAKGEDWKAQVIAPTGEVLTQVTVRKAKGQYGIGSQDSEKSPLLPNLIYTLHVEEGNQVRDIPFVILAKTCDPNHTWQVQMNHDVVAEGLSDKIKILNFEGESMPIEVHAEGPIIFVRPKYSYFGAQIYRLVVKAGIKGIDGRELKRDTLVYFRVK